MRKKLTLAGVCLSALIYSQSNVQDYTNNTNDAGRNIPKIFPTTPESFKFSQYGNIPIGTFTGAPNINIPITELTVDGISIPISLNYTSNGINVDEMNGSVGLGWTFISAGVITRTIRDKPDEQSSYNSGDVPLVENFASQMTEYLKFCEIDDFDSEPDLYTANFGGNQVKFLINKSGKIMMIDQKDYIIKKNDQGNLFSITLDNGTRYNFNALEHIVNRTLNVGGHQPPQQYPQSWYLTSVVNTNGNTITIEYQNVNYSNIISLSQSLTYTVGNQQKYGDPVSGPNGGSSCPIKPYTLPENNIGLIAESRQEVSGKQIYRIYDSDNNSIVFSYAPQNEDYSKLLRVQKKHGSQIIDDVSFSYSTTANSRLFLTEVRNNKSSASYQFAYYNPEIFPSRLTFARDMWGYYNGMSNPNLIPQIFNQNDPASPKYTGSNQSVNPTVGYYGLLKTMTYPSGGNTQFNYENHKKKENVKIVAQETTAGLSVFNAANSYQSTKEITITPTRDALIRIGLSVYLYPYGKCKNSPILETKKQKGSLTVQDPSGNYKTLSVLGNNNSFYSVGNSAEVSLNSGAQTLYVSGIKNQPLKINLTALFACSDAYANAYYYASEDHYVMQDVLLGGYRISSTKDTPMDGLSITKKYRYVKDNGEYSVHITREPLFKEDRKVGSVCLGGALSGTTPLFLNYTAITSSNIGRLFSFNPNIFYDTVEEEIEGNGKVVHHFSAVKDYWGNPIKGDPILSAPWTNSGWNNGKELMTVYKDQNNAILKTVENNFVEDPSRTVYLGAINRRKLFEPVLNDGTWNGFENLDAVYYQNISRFTYLQSQKKTDFFNGSPAKTETQYFYNNPAHQQLTKQSTSFSDGKVNETTYRYAHEKGNPLMISKNMIGITLETTTAQTIGSSAKILAKTETIYPVSQSEANTKSSGLVLPLSVKSYDLQNTAATEVTYNQYDDKGNLQQYTTKDGIPVSIIWGYNSTQPVAKINGITYTQLMTVVPSLVSDIVLASEKDANPSAYNLQPEITEADLISKLDTLRKSLRLIDTQITTYTYDPLIGVRSITPPSGVREVYVYDSANRLMEIREQNQTGKLLKEFKYNYKN